MKMSCPFSIWCRDSNSGPLEHESPPITTRPGLPPHCTNLVILWVLLKQPFGKINLPFSLFLLKYCSSVVDIFEFLLWNETPRDKWNSNRHSTCLRFVKALTVISSLAWLMHPRSNYRSQLNVQSELIYVRLSPHVDTVKTSKKILI